MGLEQDSTRRLTLALIYAAGAALIVFALVVPGWVVQGRGVVGLVAAAALCTAIGLLVVPSLRDLAAHALLSCGSTLIAVQTAAAGGGTASVCFAMFACWAAMYASVFFTTTAAVLHTSYALVAVGGTLAVVTPHAGVVPFVLLASILGSSAAGMRVLVDRLRLLGRLDPLTGVLNEAGLRSAIAGRPRGDGRGLLLLDIQDFSQINGALGRDGGDALLQAFALAACEVVSPDGQVARLSADTFGVLVDHPGCDGDSVAELAHRAARELTRAYAVDASEVDVTVVVGAASAVSAEPTGVLFERATAALAAAKREERSVRLWGHELVRDAARQLTLQLQLRRGIARDELVLHFQPQYDARSGVLRGAEALVRWQHPTQGLLFPGAFLPAAEPTTIIHDLTVWVLGEAVRQAAAWQPLAAVPVSVNLSPRLLAFDGLVDLVAGVLAMHGLPADKLVLEVTETAVTAQPDKARDVLRLLHELGVRISLDDFGTGYTSLGMLADLPLDELKVDRRFVSGARVNERDAAIVRSVASLGRRLGFSLVAEGVEDEQTHTLLARWGYDVIQGFLLSKPLPLHALHAELARGQQGAEASPAGSPDADEQARLAQVKRIEGLRDEEFLTTAVQVAAQTCGTPEAVVAVLGATELTFVASCGGSVAPVSRAAALCQSLLSSRTLLEVPDTLADPRFQDSPVVTGGPRLRFYAAVPLVLEGQVVGSLAAVDVVPGTLTAEQREALVALGSLVSAHLHLRAAAVPA